MKVRKHLAIKKKIKIFLEFDKGKRPSDIEDTFLTRSTLYQYYAEWRREKGVAGKATGFALKRYPRNKVAAGPTIVNASKDISLTVNQTTKDRENLDKFILDCGVIIDALKHPKAGTLFLPGSKTERYLADILRIKEKESGKPVFFTYDRYIQLFSMWIEIAKSAADREDFYRICAREALDYTVPGL